MDSPGPRLPWEVIERAIGNLSGHRETLQSLALTCHQLLPSTRLVMFAHVRFKSRDHVFAFVDFLHENPHLMPVVRSFTVWPPDLAPFPLLSLLPNLSAIKFDDPDALPWWSARTRRHLELGVHQSSLTCLQRFGTSIRTLHLSDLHYKTYMSFARMLSAFVHVTHLVCENVVIHKPGQNNGEALGLPVPETVKRWLREGMRLKALTVGYNCLIDSDNGQATNLGRLLLDSNNSILSVIENLTLRGSVRNNFLDKYRCDWSSLRSLTFKLQGLTEEFEIDEGVEALEGFRKCPSLTDVTLEWPVQLVSSMNKQLFHDEKKTEKLEHTFLAFSKPRFICSLNRPLSTNGSSLWHGELRQHFPALSQRGAVTLQSLYKLDVFLGPGHDERVRALAFSPDSGWVASGSDDSTIILWDASNGTIAQQWVAHGYLLITALAFSPDSGYIVSVGLDDKAAIWDLSGEPRKVATLEACAPHVPGTLQAHSDYMSECAWSPDGRAIATGSYDGSVCFWDALTFELKARIYELSGTVTDLIFSPNGSWLCCMSSEDECSILDAASGALHKSLDRDGYTYLPTDDPLGRPFMRSFSTRRAAFDPTGTRLALASDITSEIIDIETGNTLLVLDRDGPGRKRNTRTISFSLDGRLVLEVDYDTCYIWDAFTGTKLSQLKGHGHDILGARFSSCRKYIASTSYDKKIRLWRTSDGSCLTTLSDHEDQVTHVAFSPDGKTLSSADSGGRVIIRRMRDMIPPIDTQDGPALIAPSPLPVINLSPHPSPLSDGHAGLSLDDETDPEQKEVGERRIEEDAASSGRPGPRQPTACAFFERDEEDEESAVIDSPIAGDQRAGSAARSSLCDSISMATPSGPIAVDGDGSTSSARLSSVTAVEYEAPRAQEQPHARKALEDVDGAVAPQAPQAARQEENEKRTEGNMADSGRLGLQQPIAGASTQRDEDRDDSTEGNSPTADRANRDARASPEICEAAVEDLSTDATRPSLPTPADPESEASTNQGRPPTRAAQVDAHSEDHVQATPVVGQETATRSDSAMAGDGIAGGQRAVSAARSSLSDSMATMSESIAVDGDSSTSSARLSSQPPSREALEDANALAQAQAQAAPSVEQKDPEGSSVVSAIASPKDRAANSIFERPVPQSHREILGGQENRSPRF